MKNIFTFLLIISTIFLSHAQNKTRVFVDVSRHTGTISKVQIQIEQESWSWLDATQDTANSDIWYYDITSYGDAANPAKVQYLWGINDGATTTKEDIGASCYGGNLEHDFVFDYKEYSDTTWTTAGEDAFNTTWYNLFNRAILTNGTAVQSSNKFYFGSMRNNTVSSTTITLSGATTGNTYYISNDKGTDTWDQWVDLGSVDNGDGTFTATVRNTAAFKYIWGSGTGKEIKAGGVVLELADMETTCGANRVQTAGRTGADTWATCPQTASIEDLSNSFAIYPNPMGSQLTVEGISEVQHASIFDLTGREVLRATPNKAVFTLDTADLQSGVYMLSLQVGDNEITKKLMK